MQKTTEKYIWFGVCNDLKTYPGRIDVSGDVSKMQNSCSLFFIFFVTPKFISQPKHSNTILYKVKFVNAGTLGSNFFLKSNFRSHKGV